MQAIEEPKDAVALDSFLERKGAQRAVSREQCP